MTIPVGCVLVRTHKRISVSESGRTFTLVNPKQIKISVVTVDGCAIREGERCDYMYSSSSGRELYLELKGSDIRKAVAQIQASVLQLSPKGSRKLRTAVIVSSRVPSEDTSTMIAKRKLIQEVVASLRIKNGSLEVSAVDVL